MSISLLFPALGSLFDYLDYKLLIFDCCTTFSNPFYFFISSPRSPCMKGHVSLSCMFLSQDPRLFVSSSRTTREIVLWLIVRSSSAVLLVLSRPSPSFPLCRCWNSLSSTTTTPLSVFLPTHALPRHSRLLAHSGVVLTKNSVCLIVSTVLDGAYRSRRLHCIDFRDQLAFLFKHE